MASSFTDLSEVISINYHMVEDGNITGLLSTSCVFEFNNMLEYLHSL